MLLRSIPFLFVLLWASGFVGARLGLQYAEPATLLAIRMLANIALFLLLIVLLRRRVPTGAAFWHSCVVGLGIHGFYLGGTYWAISLGMPAGLSSLLVGIQPILTALILVVTVQERFRFSQWLGLALGLLGISLVLSGKMDWQTEAHKTLAITLCLIALVGITLGTLYQKRFCHGVDMVGGAMVQYLAATCLFLPFAWQFETMQVQWTTTFILTLVWLVVVLSCAAILLLLYMVKNGAASSVASVFYLVPPVTALQAWLMFGESFDAKAMVGFLLAAVAVYLVVRKPKLAVEPVRSETCQIK
ncbi:TPA: EamA family transporter [Vibrio vulnificus]|uniref:DMT family transporter n=1 Tax=Vibrio vulnificus TaxID=672 RepID=UPI001A1F4AA4|nr:EamA family transporter [Vibrio vulnificus]HAS6274867.1 EamA family transporter [Vibrio vulnificus]HDY7537607.1 DMT family transporter [Vibrio vulnificus]HDY8040894.1 DMT family transporter [Vibrio vulnificus]HDY8236370.1 DMT family transporter [Vibrio vulnificus]